MISGNPRMLLAALQNADGQFPSGGFAFSQGLEASAQYAERLGGFSLRGFLDVQIRNRWATADRVALVRAFRQQGDLKRLAELDHEVEASTFVEGLRLGSRRNGMALLTAHKGMGSAAAASYRVLIQDGQALGHLPVVQALVWSELGLSEEVASAMGGYQAASSLVTAAVRLSLVGAIAAQRLLRECLDTVSSVCSMPVADDEAIGAFVPLADIAVTLHGNDGQRLFSN